MPIHEYECLECDQITESFFVLGEDLPDEVPCPCCGGKTKRILSNVSIQDGHPTWLDQSVRDAIQTEDEPPIESREDYKKVLREKNIVER